MPHSTSSGMSSTTTVSFSGCPETLAIISARRRATSGMDDAVQRRAFVVVAERLGGQRGPVQRPVGKQDVLAERVDELGQPFGARFDDFAGDDVTVDDDTAAFGESG